MNTCPENEVPRGFLFFFHEIHPDFQFYSCKDKTFILENKTKFLIKNSKKDLDNLQIYLTSFHQEDDFDFITDSFIRLSLSYLLTKEWMIKNFVEVSEYYSSKT